MSSFNVFLQFIHAAQIISEDINGSLKDVRLYSFDLIFYVHSIHLQIFKLVNF